MKMDMSDSRKQQPRILVVSNRLPVRLERQDNGFRYRPSVGGLATTLDALRKEMSMLWVGTPGLKIEDRAMFATVEKDLRRQFDSVPLDLDTTEFDSFYAGFSNGSLWPLFHYFPQYAHYDEGEWQAYREVNQHFCEKVVEIAQPNDLIWVHDYHLLLLPRMIREAIPDATIGFFLHIPFPSYELFRMLPWREQILRGMIGSDLIGFHSYGYARHFLSSLMRILGLEHDFGTVMVDSRAVRVDTFPLGVDVARFAATGEDPEVQAELADLRRQVQDRKVILSVDRLDFTKGILQRLEAFEMFLERNPSWQGRVTLLTLLVPSRTQVPEYQALKSQVDEMVGRINGRFGQPAWSPIWYLYRSLPFKKLVALYLLADVALVTPLRDGMNLVAKEYLATRTDGSGVLVLSETAGAAEELGEALIINPHDLRQMTDALAEALEMPREQQILRNEVMRARLKRYDTTHWAQEFISQLEASRAERDLNRPRHLRGKAMDALLESYTNAKRRLILLDYDGTLVSFAPTPKAAKPDDALLVLLKELAAGSKTHVVILSGRDPETLGDWLGGLGVDLVAEHGGLVRYADRREWESLTEGVSVEWKAQLRPLLEVFVDRTPGALLEEKAASLVWHYRRADPDLGRQRAAELTEALQGYVANTNLHILQGHKVIEVKPSNVSKGGAAQVWLKRKPRYDFVLVIGDDQTDEAMFQVMPKGGWSIKVGSPEHSAASYFVSAPYEVRDLLERLLRVDTEAG